MAALLLKTPQTQKYVVQLAEFIKRAEGHLTVLTGAGISTDSGVPDYRGPRGIYIYTDYRPIRFQEFISAHSIRQRYWSRSFLGFPRIMRARPNRSHHAVHGLQEEEWISGLITQNVDGLHRGEGIVEMHGTLHKVHCLSCKHTISRADWQQTIADLNPELVDWVRRNPNAGEGDVASSTAVRPDGDIETAWDYSRFEYPHCESCRTGMYKPSVIFFGENIAPESRDQTFRFIDDSQALLCIGTSLQVYSAYRLALRAKAAGQPVAVLSLGETRADPLVDLKIMDGCSDVLEGVQEQLCKHSSH
ncbi:DHS-like NAD/FAD-binding domain-containing protein [Powellomyces hirtus]|nr:DHS-like NAD/FAD-binding domain-containing protein [Powellomyces hirtus]